MVIQFPLFVSCKPHFQAEFKYVVNSLLVSTFHLNILFGNFILPFETIRLFRKVWFCPGVPVHKGIMIVLSLFRSHWLLAVAYCLVCCIGSCEPVHEDRTKIFRSVELELSCHLYSNQNFPNFRLNGKQPLLL